MNFILQITANVWNKDSNILYDYEASDLTSSTIKTSSKGVILRRINNVIFQKDSIKKDFDISIYLISINIQNNSYFISHNIEKVEKENGLKTFEGKPWIAIKQTYSSHIDGFKLRPSDIIKVGKIGFRVREMQGEKKEDNLKTFQEDRIRNANAMKITEPNPIVSNILKENIVFVENQNEIHSNEKRVKKMHNSPVCRICFNDDKELSDSLICPCKCSGTMKYIHIDCLKMWLKSKITTKSYTYLTVHSFKNLECEVCKVIIPEKIKIKETVYNLLELKRPESKYIILESLSKDNSKSEKKFVYIIHMKDKNNIKIGRSNDSDVRISDISVSRNHASLIYSEGSFFFQDHSSKFGSLVSIQKDLIIMPNKHICIQTGKTVLTFKFIRKFISFLTCFKYKPPFSDYSEYFDFLASKSNEEIMECGYHGSEQVSELSSIRNTRNHEEDIVSRIHGGDESLIEKTAQRIDTCEFSPAKSRREANNENIGRNQINEDNENNENNDDVLRNNSLNFMKKEENFVELNSQNRVVVESKKKSGFSNNRIETRNDQNFMNQNDLTDQNLINYETQNILTINAQAKNKKNFETEIKKKSLKENELELYNFNQKIDNKDNFGIKTENSLNISMNNFTPHNFITEENNYQNNPFLNFYKEGSPKVFMGHTAERKINSQAQNQFEMEGNFTKAVKNYITLRKRKSDGEQKNGD